MRALAFFLAAIALSGPARGACTARTMGETRQSYIDALAERMKKAGIAEIDPVMMDEGGPGTVLYALLGSKVVMQTVEKDGLVEEIGTIVDAPQAPADTDRQFTLAAFTIARVSGEQEASIKSRLYHSSGAHPENGSWLDKFGDATAVWTRTGSALIIKLGELTCE